MLHDADASLACWLARVLPAGTNVRFDAPNPGWADRPPDPPFVDAFLYDVREDGDHARPAGWSEIRDTDGRAVGRQQPPRHYRLRYLVTAWTSGPALAPPGDRDAGVPGGQGAAVPDSLATSVPDGPGLPVSGSAEVPLPGSPEMTEHELLSVLLYACAATDVLPAGCLRGTLAGTGLPVLLRCAPADRNADPTRWWTGFGLPPRAFLELLLIVPLLLPLDSDLAPPAREIALDMAKPGTEGNGSADDITAIDGMTGLPDAKGLAAQRRKARAPGKHWERSRITEHTMNSDPPSR